MSATRLNPTIAEGVLTANTGGSAVVSLPVAMSKVTGITCSSDGTVFLTPFSTSLFRAWRGTWTSEGYIPVAVFNENITVKYWYWTG